MERREPQGHGGRRTISSLAVGDPVDGVYLVRKLDLRRTRAGKDFIACELVDATGFLAARHFDGTRALYDRLVGSQFVRATGRIEEWAHELQIKLNDLAPAPAPADLGEFVEHTPFDVDTMLDELRTFYGEKVRDRHVKRLLLSFLDDADFVARLRGAPAASSYHHSYAGGLLEHIVSLTRLAERVCAAYPRLDRDLVIAGMFLHDIGKVDELGWNQGFQYTDRGQLVGHIGIGLLFLEERTRAIRGFPERLKDVLRHLILSHHGEKEFGSPVLPVTPEAFVVHMLDNLDGRLWSAFRAQDDRGGDASWSGLNRHLGRRIYRAPAEAATDGESADTPTQPARAQQALPLGGR